MTKSSFTALSLLTVLAVLLTLTGALFSQFPLEIAFKPLATVFILLIAVANWRQWRDPYSFWIIVGLFFSLVGDVALLWPTHYFLPGLGAFLCTHVAYLFAFTRNVRFPARPGVWLLYLAPVAALYAFLFPVLPAGLKLPVAFYSLFLASMAAQSMGCFLILRTPAARLAAFGTLFFMISDSLLSLDRFRTPIPLAPLLVLFPYYVAQWLVASSTNSS